MNNNETNLIINLNEVCRVCLLKTECMVSLANVDNEDILKLLGKLSSVSNLEIEINDVYPSNLCKVCEEKVLQFYEFQMQAQKSHNLMLEFVNQPPEFVNVEEDDEAKVEYTDEELNEKTDQRTSTNQTMRLQQYSAEAVNEAVKRFRDRIPKHTDCIRCTFKSASTRSLGVHVARLHKEVKDSWCSYCNQLFDNLSEHKSQHLHDCLKCEFCNKTLLSTSHFLEHLASHSSERAHRCQVCDKSFISKRHLLSHYRIHSVEKPFKCHCGVTFLTTNTLRAHINKNHVGTKMVCEMCQEEFEDVEVYEGHSCFDEGGMNVTKKIDILPQNFCTECNKKVRSLVNHKKKFHNPSGAEGVLNAPSTSLLCTYCGKQFKTNSKLNVHIRVHTGETPYKCRYCLKQMGTRNQLVVHERVHTGEKPHICRVCGKGFAQTSVLNTHMRLHTGRPELCTICLKRFCRPAELRLHMRQHTGEKPYCCAECGQTFKQKSHLVEHTKTHSNERPFPCAYCDKAFKQNSSLKAHTQIHLGKKPFKCSQCTYACRQSYSLHQHMLQHDKDLPDPQRPHKCLVCHKTFTTHAMMYSHYTSVHADDEAMGKIEPVE